MKDKHVDKYLLDIIESIDAIREFSQNIHNSKELSVKHLERSAIERKLEIIGEALNNAQVLDPEFSVANIKKIVATRHIIVHDYDGINYRIIWDVITNHLGVLRKEAEELLNQK